MKKLLTIKQLIETDKEQDLNAELLEQPYDRVRKNELKFVPRNIVSDIENGIEIISVYPNPAEDKIWCRVISSIDSDINIFIYDEKIKR